MGNWFALDGSRHVMLQTSGTIETTVALVTDKLRGLVQSIGGPVVLTIFLAATAAMIDLVRGTFVLTLIIVGFQAMMTEISTSQKNLPHWSGYHNVPGRTRVPDESDPYHKR